MSSDVVVARTYVGEVYIVGTSSYWRTSNVKSNIVGLEIAIDDATKRSTVSTEFTIDHAFVIASTYFCSCKC
jgi:hypothetical protein